MTFKKTSFLIYLGTYSSIKIAVIRLFSYNVYSNICLYFGINMFVYFNKILTHLYNSSVLQYIIFVHSNNDKI